MARIFNIYFNYNGSMRSAMVSVRTTPFFTEYTLDFDEELMELLPGNKIISTASNHFTFQHASSLEVTPLMKEIIGAVSQQSQKTEV
ncbi:MAG: hypothetical protein ACTHOF_17375 [Flavisolibacter sp.]|jgi:hypothetical protein